MVKEGAILSKTDEELAGFAVALIALITYLSLLRELRATIPESIISPSR